MFLPSSSGPPLKIGIIRNSSIGDVVLATSCLNFLSQLNMPVEITWLGRKPAIDLIGSCYTDLNCLDLDESVSKKELLHKLSGIHFLIDLQSNIRSHLLGLAFRRFWKRPVYTIKKQTLLRRKLVLEARLRGRSQLISQAAANCNIYQYQNMTNTVRKALEKHLPPELRNDLRDLDPVPKLPLTYNNHLKLWEKELAFGCWLAIAPGASYQMKRAPVKIWQKIISETKDKYYQIRGSTEVPLGLLILGDQDDRQFSLDLLNKLSWNDPVLNMAGLLTLSDSALALRGRACLLSNDSSLAHIAEAVETPVAVLFGPTVEGFGFAPHMPQSQSFSVPLGCRPCSIHGQGTCRFGDMRCFSDLPVEKISGYVVRLLVEKINKPDSVENRSETESKVPL